MRWWAFALCIAAMAPYALIVGFYGLRSPWFTSSFGRSFLLSKTVITLLLSHVLLVLVIGDYPGRVVVWATLFVLTAIAGSWQLTVLLRAQCHPADDHPRRRLTDHP